MMQPSLVPIGSRKKQKPSEDTLEASGEKCSDLENVLRQQKIEMKQETENSGGTLPNEQQKQDITKYVQQDGLVHKFANELGNYSNVTSQMSHLNYEFVRAMDVSTLDSKSELYRVDQLNNSMVGQMLASQHGIMHASKKALKRNAKVHKLSTQDSWI